MRQLSLVALVVCACAVVASPTWAQTVSANADHTLVVKPDGSLWGWGGNSNGQLGINSTTRQDLPVAVSTLSSGVVGVAAGQMHSLALKSDGTVWAWGWNGSGQLGLGDTTQRLVPVQIPTFTNVVAIAAGTSHSVAVKSDGTVWIWGANNVGQLGTSESSSTVRNSPFQISSLSGVTAITSRANHTLALKSDGTVAAWGQNSNGQLGNGGTTNQFAPVSVSSLTSVTAISAGDAHSLALKSDGAAWGWGWSGSGQVGNGSFSSQITTPVAVSNLGAVVAIAAGGRHSLALRADGTALAWGSNIRGQLSDATTYGTQSALPVSLSGTGSIATIAAGYDHTLVATTDGLVWAAGLNANAQIGDGTRVNRSLLVKVSEAGYVWKVGTPTFSIPSGTYTAIQNVVVASVTAGATIHYTLNGAVPTEADPTVPGNGIVSVTESLTLKAKAWKSGIPESNSDSATYALRVATPTLSPGTGTYAQSQTVTVSSSVPGVTLRYTTNGADPTTSDPVIASGGTLAVAQSLTLKVRGWRDNWTVSDQASATYTLKVATPSLTPVAGLYTSAQNVTVTTATAGAVLRYTTTGAEPSSSDATVASGGTLLLDTATTLKVKGFRDGWTTSDLTMATYTFALGTVAVPTFTPAAGTYTLGQSVSMATSTPGATIRYTTDGTDPTLLSTLSTGPLQIDRPTTIKARGFKRDWIGSTTATAAYTFDTGTVAMPALSPVGGDYPSSRLVTVSTATSGATIRYTTNGLEPTETDPTIVSGGSLLVDRAIRVRAKAFKDGLTPSAVVTADYWITGMVVAGENHTVALKADGTVWAWGANAQGQVGNNTTIDQKTPVQAVGLTDVIAISAGTDHTLAVKRDGTVWGWGANTAGKLGESTAVIRRTVPTQIAGISDVIGVAAGENHSAAVKRDGTVCVWGNNSAGQLGDGSGLSLRTSPYCLAITGVAAIAAGGQHTIALKTDGSATGSVWVWGSNQWGQLGDGTQTNRTTPLRVLDAATAVAAGLEHSLALLPDGTVRGWGRNTEAELGDGTQVNALRPVTMANLEEVVQISAGRRFSQATTREPSVWTSGEALGSTLVLPYRIAGAGTTVIGSDAGGYHGVAARRDGSVWTWGPNSNGQLGDGTTTTRYSPRAVPAFSLVDAVWLTGDPDADALQTWRELELGSDPFNADTNGDGLRDGAAVRSGLSVTNLDMDADTVSNALERQNGTDPFGSDSDGDGHPDGSDAFPLDPSRWTAPPPVQGDTTPPVILLIFPTNAVRIWP